MTPPQEMSDEQWAYDSTLHIESDVERATAYRNMLLVLSTKTKRIEELEADVIHLKDLLRVMDNDYEVLEEKITTLEQELQVCGEGLNYIFHAVRGCSEVMVGDGFGDIVPKNSNLKNAYLEVQKALAQPYLKRVMEAK